MVDYAMRFRDPNFDCLDGDYRCIYEVTSALGPEVLNATTLANRIVSGGETTHQAFAVALHVNDTVNIACVHRIFRYPGSFTESSPWDNKLFEILGDITTNQIPLVHIAPEVFAVAGSVYAPTLPTMNEALANWEPHSYEKGEFIGPMSDAAGNSLYGQYNDYITGSAKHRIFTTPLCRHASEPTNPSCTSLARDRWRYKKGWTYQGMRRPTHLVAGCQLLGQT